MGCNMGNDNKTDWRVNIEEIRMLKWMCGGVTRGDRIRNQLIMGSEGVAEIIEKMRESRLRYKKM